MAPDGKSRLLSSHHSFETVQEFVSASKRAESMSDLRALIDVSSKELGFD